MTTNKNPRFTGVLEADEGTRTLDLLHGKDVARADWARLGLTFRTVLPFSRPAD